MSYESVTNPRKGDKVRCIDASESCIDVSGSSKLTRESIYEVEKISDGGLSIKLVGVDDFWDAARFCLIAVNVKESVIRAQECFIAEYGSTGIISLPSGDAVIKFHQNVLLVNKEDLTDLFDSLVTVYPQILKRIDK